MELSIYNKSKISRICAKYIVYTEGRPGTATISQMSTKLDGDKVSAVLSECYFQAKIITSQTKKNQNKTKEERKKNTLKPCKVFLFSC